MDLQKLRQEDLGPKLAAQLAPFVNATRPHDKPLTVSELRDNNNLARAIPRVSHVAHRKLVHQTKKFRTTWLPDLEYEADDA